MIVCYIFVGLLFAVTIVYCRLFYPQQRIKPSTTHDVFVKTPEVTKYNNDVLHPCVRRMSDGRFVMVQSPWYKCRNDVENPILYVSDDPMKWDDGIVVEETPEYGYNSDPNVYEENGRIYVFWREYKTPFCKSNNALMMTVGVYTDNYGKSFSSKQIYLTNTEERIDSEICPIMIKKNNTYRFYTTWYQITDGDRHNLGISIWEGTNLENPDFRLLKQVPFRTKYICDKYKQLKILGHIFFIPMHHKFDLWHFDLLEKEGKLYMFASEEMGDVEMIAVSKDWENFKLIKKPIINAHYMENIVGYRQNYYKPTAFIRDDGKIQFYYTANRDKNSYTYSLHATIIDVTL